MIGQSEILDRLNQQWEEDLLPRFLIFVGAVGMGKKTLMREFAKQHWKMVIELPDVKVDTIRNMIDEAYKLSSSTVYIIPDADKMSVNAKNSLLKITEEPPNRATFLMSVVSMEQTLETIKSRGTAYYMRPYTSDEKLQYLRQISKDTWSDEDVYYIMMMSNSLYDIDRLSRIDPGALESFAKKLVDNISKVSVANALKTSGSIKFKEDSDGYDLDLVFRACLYAIAEKLFNDNLTSLQVKMYRDMMDETLARIGDINNSSISKPNTYDTWLLNCRKIIKECRNGDK